MYKQKKKLSSNARIPIARRTLSIWSGFDEVSVSTRMYGSWSKYKHYSSGLLTMTIVIIYSIASAAWTWENVPRLLAADKDGNGKVQIEELAGVLH